MRLVILGAGGYGRTVADVAAQTGRFEEIRFLDDHSTAPDVMGACCDFSQMIDDETAFYPAFGNNEVRMGWLHRLMESGCNVPAIIHPTAYISPTAQVMPGAMILPHVIVNTDCGIKAGCIVNCGAIIDHGCVLEVGVHICLGVIVKVENRIPRCMKIEAGEVVQNRTDPALPVLLVAASPAMMYTVPKDRLKALPGPVVPGPAGVRRAGRAESLRRSCTLPPPVRRATARTIPATVPLGAPGIFGPRNRGGN